MKAIGIDIGTTSVCGVVLDVNSGEVVKSVTKNSNAFLKGCGDWEKIQNVDKIEALAKEILDGFIEEYDIKAIGVTGQMHGIVYTDKDGCALSPLYTWQDGRGNLPYKDTTYAKYLNSFSGYGNVTDFYNRENGLVPEDAVSYCTIHDYFVMRLTGNKKAVMHASDAASLGLYNMKENKFDYCFEAEVTSDYRIAGEYKKIPVSVAIGDNQASVLSTLADETNVLLNVGTGSQVSVISDKIISGENLETRPYFGGKYLVVGAALCGGRAYSVLKNFYSEVLSYAEDVSDSRVYEIMEKMLEKADKSKKLKADTRFAGTRSNSDICGGIFNITEENFTSSNLTFAVLEGMADELYNMYKDMKISKSGIVGSGNGIRKNSALVKVFEDRFSSNMKIPAHLEEAAVGAALFAMTACGLIMAEDIKNMIRYE